jgi:hypothetical protein
MATGWGQYPQGAFYPPPVQPPVEIKKPEPRVQEVVIQNVVEEKIPVVPMVECNYCAGEGRLAVVGT